MGHKSAASQPGPYRLNWIGLFANHVPIFSEGSTLMS